MEPLTALIVDDLELNRQLHVRYARSAGFAVDTAEHGRMAVDAVQARRYDLVITDVDMPVLNGLEATREIRDLERRGVCPRMIIIAVTGSEDPGECYAAGVSYFVSKSDSQALRTLLKRLRDTLQSR